MTELDKKTQNILKTIVESSLIRASKAYTHRDTNSWVHDFITYTNNAARYLLMETRKGL